MPTIDEIRRRFQAKNPDLLEVEIVPKAEGPERDAGPGRSSPVAAALKSRPVPPSKPGGVAAAVRADRHVPPSTPVRSSSARYRMDGADDAILAFGKHSGRSLSELAETMEGRGYLRWLLSEDFPDDLKAAAQEQLARSY